MTTLKIDNVNLVLPDRIAEQRSVHIENGRISSISEADGGGSGPQEDLGRVDGRGNYLAPGFIDLHIHGLHDKLVDSGPDHLHAICSLLPRYGVTGFLPTVLPLPVPEHEQYLETLAAQKSDAARILGFFLEGPFLGLTGAIPPDALIPPTEERVRTLIKAAEPYKAVFAISPELPKIDSLIPIMRESGAPVFITHTAANVEQAKRAIEAGARHATHFYNVFYPPPERDGGVRPCGIVEAVLADPRVSIDFILDGEHVEPVALEMGLEVKGPDRVCLITDANLGAGFPPGRYKGLGGSEIEFAYEGAPARMCEGSASPGGLAGSGLTLDRAVRNAREFIGLDIPTAIRLVSKNPAKVLGIDDRFGEIAEGYEADLVLLDDELKVLKTWKAGKLLYSSES